METEIKQTWKSRLEIRKRVFKDLSKNDIQINGNVVFMYSNFHFIFSSDVAVLVRSVGATKDSTNIRKLLLSLCRQLCVVFGNDLSEVPTVNISFLAFFVFVLSDKSANL